MSSLYVWESIFVSKNQVCTSNEMVLWISKPMRNNFPPPQTHSDVKPLGEVDEIEVLLAYYCCQNILHRFSDSNNINFLFYSFGWQKSKMGVRRLKSRCQQGCVGNLFPWLFHLLETPAFLGSWPLFTCEVSSGITSSPLTVCFLLPFHF